MNLKTLSLIIPGLFVCLQVQAASHIDLLAPQSGDLSATALVAAPEAAAATNGVAAPNAAFAPARHEPVAVSWASQGEVNLAAKPFVGQSHEYYRKVTGAQLNAGIDLNTSASHALVRLQAMGPTGQREKDAIVPQSLQLKTKDGRVMANGTGMEAIVTAQQMAKADLPFASGTSAFRIHPSLGSGTFKLQASRLNDTQEYLINVVEPDSPYSLNLQAEAANYLHGQTLVLHGNLAGPAKNHAMQKIDAVLVSPAGREFPLSFKAGAGQSYRAQLTLDANEAPTPGLWEVRAQVDTQVNGQTVQRSVRIALPVAMPVARLNGPVQLQEANGGMGLRFGVETASAGRYEVRGMLYGTVGGKLVPVAMADSAKWLESGKGDIDLSYDAALMQGVSAPYEIRDVMLLDQGRFAVLQKQARGMVIEAADMHRAGVVIGVVQNSNTLVGNGFLRGPQKSGLAQ
jgi:hypothetical protein